MHQGRGRRPREVAGRVDGHGVQHRRPHATSDLHGRVRGRGRDAGLPRVDATGGDSDRGREDAADAEPDQHLGRQDHGGVAAGRRQLGQQRQPAGGHEQPGRDQGPRGDAVHQPARDAVRASGDGQAHRQEREPRADRAVPEHHLEVVGQHQEHPEGADHADRGGGVRRGAAAVPQDGQRQQGSGQAALAEQERREQAQAGEPRDQDLDGGPAVGGGLAGAEHQPGQPAGREQPGDDVDRDRVAVVLRQHPTGDGDHHGRDEHVDVEAPAPAGVLGQHAAEQQTDDGAAAGDRAEHAERLAAFARLGEGRGDQGERRRRHERGARTLQRAAGHEDLERRRRTGQRGRQAEAGEPDRQRPAPSDPVRGLAAEQQQPGEGERVRRDDVRAVRVVEAEHLLGGRQRDVHDGRVERDHQLGESDHAERGPTVVGPRGRFNGTGGGGHEQSFHKWSSFLRFTLRRRRCRCQ